MTSGVNPSGTPPPFTGVHRVEEPPKAPLAHEVDVTDQNLARLLRLRDPEWVPEPMVRELFGVDVSLGSRHGQGMRYSEGSRWEVYVLSFPFQR